ESCQVEELQGAARVLGAAAGFLGEAGYSVYAEQGDDEVGEGGPDLRPVSGADEGFVFFPDHVAQPVGADVGEQVFGGGFVRGEAGDAEDGLRAGVPLAFLLVRGVALDEQGLAGVLEAGVFRGGENADGTGLDAPAAA